MIPTNFAAEPDGSAHGSIMSVSSRVALTDYTSQFAMVFCLAVIKEKLFLSIFSWYLRIPVLEPDYGT
jgi:hypothetical protein